MQLLGRSTGMPSVVRIIGGILATAGLLGSALVFSQTTFSQTTGGVAASGVEGFVRNLSTGQPIADVRVTLTPETGGAGKSAVTDAEGRFIMRDVVPGRYNVAATRTLFFRPPRSSGTTVLTVLAGQQYKDLQIQLLPTAVIAGRVVDENRQALRSVRVEALRTGYRDGQIVWTMTAQSTSDDRGEYRLFNLSPGTYYVRATRTVAPSQMGQIYYPSVTEPQDAIPISLQAGMEVGAVDLQMRAANRYTIQLMLGGVAPNSMISFTLQRRASPIADLQLPRFETLPGNTYRLPDVYPGSYDILVQAANPPAPSQPRVIAASARIPVNVSTDNIDLGTVPLNPSIAVAGRLVPADTLTSVLDPNRITLSLRPLDLPPTFASTIRGAPDASGNAAIKPDGSLLFPAVAPGRYQIVMTGLPADTYVIAAREIGRDILDTGYVVTGNQGPLEIVIGGSGSMAGMEGVVVNARGDAVPSSIVALVPSAERRGNPAAFRSTTADQNGHFSFRGILPGNYTIFAWEEVDTGAWVNAEFVKKIESAGQAVRLQRGDQSVVNVRVIPAQ